MIARLEPEAALELLVDDRLELLDMGSRIGEEDDRRIGVRKSGDLRSHAIGDDPQVALRNLIQDDDSVGRSGVVAEDSFTSSRDA